jgi:hypothetical protein
MHVERVAVKFKIITLWPLVATLTEITSVVLRPRIRLLGQASISIVINSVEVKMTIAVDINNVASKNLFAIVAFTGPNVACKSTLLLAAVRPTESHEVKKEYEQLALN